MKVIETNSARVKLRSGVDQVANLVKQTLGPRGQNVIIGRKYQGPLVTNDGYTIVNAVELEDEIEDLGAQYIKEVSRKTNSNAGDGTTTSIVLAQSLIDKVYTRLEGDLLGGKEQDIRRDINKSLDKVTKLLDKQAKPLTKKEDMIAVATVAAESEELGKTIAGVIEKVGPNGVVTVDDAEEPTISFSVTEGLRIDKGFAAPAMITDPAKRRAVYKRVPVLVLNAPVRDVREITPIMQVTSTEGNPGLVVVADGFEGNTLSQLVLHRLQGGFPVLCIETPGFGKKGDEEIEDLAAVVGATVVKNLTQARKEHLGFAQQIVSTEDTTTFSGGVGNVEERVNLLIEQKIEHADPEWISRRIASLKEGVGVVHVGANSAGEREYLKLKVEDAINATRAAIEEGIIPGGGVPLLEIDKKLSKDDILKDVLRAPYDQIQMNAGEKLDIPDNILDPVKVTKEALRNACSVAGTLITTNGAIAEKREEDENKK